MSESIDVSRQYTFSQPIDVISVLDRQEIQFLDVHESRMIVIFSGAILNLESLEGELSDLERAEIAVYDLPLHRDRDIENETEAAVELIEDFKNRLATSEEFR